MLLDQLSFMSKRRDDKSHWPFGDIKSQGGKIELSGRSSLNVLMLI